MQQISTDFKKSIKSIYIFNALSEFKIYSPIAVVYFSQVSGSYILGASILSISMVSSSFFEIPTGWISDILGRKKTMIVGSICSTIAVSLYALGLNYPILFIGALFEGTARSFFSGNNDALIFDVLKYYGLHHKYDEKLGKANAVLQIALGIAAVLAGVIASISFNLLLWLSVLPQFLSVIVAFNIFSPDFDKKLKINFIEHFLKSFSYFRSNNILKFLSVGSITTFSLGESVYQFQSVFVLQIWPLWAVGIANTIAHFAAAVSFFLSEKIIRRLSEIKVLIIDNFLSRISTFTALLFPSVLSPIILSFASLLFGVRMVAENVLMNQEYVSEHRATMASVNSLASSILFGLAMLIIGILVDYVGIRYALLIVESVLILNLILYIFLSKKYYILDKERFELKKRAMKILR